MRPFKQGTIGTLVLMFCSVPLGDLAAQQTSDPRAIMDQLLRDAMEDYRLRRAEQQRERILKQREEEDDREMGLRAGFRDPDVEQCVSASALYRRGIGRPAEPAEPPATDFSEFGEPTPSRPAPRPRSSAGGSSTCATAQQPTQGIYAI